MTDKEILAAAQQHIPAPVGSGDPEDNAFTSILPAIVPVILPLVLDLVKELVSKCSAAQACDTISATTGDRSGKTPASARVRRQLILQMRQRNQPAVEREVASLLPPDTRARPRVIAKARNRAILDAVEAVCSVQHTEAQVRKAVTRWQA